MRKIYFVIIALLIVGMALAACSAPEAPVEEAAPVEEEALAQAESITAIPKPNSAVFRVSLLI